MHTIATLTALKERNECKPRDEPADMRPPRDATAGRRQDEFRGSLKKLDQEPESDEHKSRNLEEKRNEQDRNDDNDPRERKQPHEASQNAGNRPGGAQCGNCRGEVKKHVRDRRSDAAYEIEG